MATRILITAVLTAALSCRAAPASAQANRTFVSGFGVDTNPCTLAKPCRSFAQALTQTAVGGEITVLDAAGYGTVTITQAVSIVNDGVGEAGVTTSGATDAITIAAGPNDAVTLVGLTLVGAGVGLNGIHYSGGGVLIVKNCAVSGFIFNGIALTPLGSTRVAISDTMVSHNQSGGIEVRPGGSGVGFVGVIERVQSIANGSGVIVDGSNAFGTVQVTATDSTMTGNGTGFLAASDVGHAAATLTILNSRALYNNIGAIVSTANATILLSGTTIAGSGSFGFDAVSPGVISSFGNNNIIDTNNGGSLTPATQQ